MDKNNINNEETTIIDDSFLTEEEKQQLIQQGNSTTSSTSSTTSTSVPPSSSYPVSSTSSSSYNNSSGGYGSRKIELVHFINEFQKDYTTTCFKRTTPYHYTLPSSFARILLGVGAKCKGSCQTDAVKLGEVLAYLGSPSGGGLKTGDTLRRDLCKMTADPFPLLESAQDKNKGQTSQAEWQKSPLYSIATGLSAAERYSKVGLSYLGELAVGKYYKLVGDNIKKVDAIKTIVPLALLRKKVMPWTLGHKTVNYSYNPSELFLLQAAMLDMAADPNNKEPWLLPDSVVSEIFKGPDVGEHYTGYMTNKSIMSLYHLGMGSVTIVPDVIIDRTNNLIEFRVPPLNTTSTDFISYLNFRILGYDPTDPKRKKQYPKFTTFTVDKCIQDADIRIIIRDVNFIGTNEEIIQELYSDSTIRVTTLLNNTVLLDNQQTDTIKMSVLEENITDCALDNFSVDTMPIHELLWRHIIDEYEVRLDALKAEKRKLEEQLEIDRFLEKVTRPEVAKFIGANHTYENKDIFQDILRKEFSIMSPDRNTELLPEGFSEWEIQEIVTESVRSSRTGLIIPNIMYHRGKYEDKWKNTLAKLQEITNKIDNPSIIFTDIKKDLLEYASAYSFKRKTKMHFVDEVKMSEDSIEYNFTMNTQLWDTLYLPCTIYYNNRFIAKSYGRNINVTPSCATDNDIKFNESLNATTGDRIYVFTQREANLYNVNSLPCSPTDMGEIRGVVPFSDAQEIMVLVSKFEYDETSKTFKYSAPCRYFTIPAGGINDDLPLEFQPNEFIKGWCYLDKKYVEFLGCSPVLDGKQTYARIPTEEIERTNTLQYLPPNLEVVLDIQGTDEESQSVPLLSSDFDGTALPDDCLYSHWPTEENNCRLNLIGQESKKFAEVFSNHLEYYCDKIYITSWKKVYKVAHEYYSHGKKSVLNELIWCRPDDPISIQLSRVIDHKASKFSHTISPMVSHATTFYNQYNIGYLADWSIINTRFNLPTARPTDESIIEFYNDYLEKMYTCDVDSKEYKKLKKQMVEVRNQIIASAVHNPFRQEVPYNNIPSLDEISDLGDEDFTEDTDL